MAGRDKNGRSAFQVGAIFLIVLGIAVYLGFAKDIPFVNPPYELKAVFADAQNMSTRAPVRVAGVEVGQVKKVEAFSDDSDLTVVTMEIKDEALPIHEDAELKIRPRIFLEGNFFVELDPGTSSTAELDGGETIPAAQTSGTVQLDEVLTSLQSDTREDLQKLLQGYGDALNGEPLPGEDDDQEPMTQGQTAAESLNDSLDTAPDALRGIAIVNDAALGHRAARPLVARHRDRAACPRRSRRRRSSSRTSSRTSTAPSPRSPPSRTTSSRRSICCRRCSSRRIRRSTT